MKRNSRLRFIHSTLIVDLERYSRIKLGVVLAPSNEDNEVISIKNVVKDSLAQRQGY